MTRPAAPGVAPGAFTEDAGMIALNLTAALLGTVLAARVSAWADRRRHRRGGSMV